MEHCDRYNRAMIPESGEKGHGKDKAVSTGKVFEDVLYRGTMPGIPNQLAVKVGICLSKMQLPPRIPAGQQTVSMCQVPPPSLGNSGNGTPQDQYATDAVVFGILFCASGQAWHLSCSTSGNDRNNLQDCLVHAQAHLYCYGAAG